MDVMTKLKFLVLGIFSSLMFVPAPALAVSAINCADPQTTVEAIQCGTDSTAGVPQGADPATTLDNTVANVVNLISLVVGVAAVVMIIVGGFRYITSGGKQESVVAAKNTIVYAVIGLVIVALAQVIVRFVLNETADSTSTTIPTNKGACTQTPYGYFWVGGLKNKQRCTP